MVATSEWADRPCDRKQILHHERNWAEGKRGYIVQTTTDFRNPSNSNQVIGQNITQINIGFATAYFSADQFGGENISPTVVLRGFSTPNAIVVSSVGPMNFSAAGWTFIDWRADTWAEDYVGIDGSLFADIITGSSFNDRIIGSAGADILAGGDGDDKFYVNAGDVVAGESIDGGSGINDRLVVQDHVLDLRVASTSAVEVLDMVGNTTVVLSGSQIGSGAITLVSSVSSESHSLIVVGSSIDLTQVGIFGWQWGHDHVSLVGTSGADTLVGSFVADTIFSGGGGDAIDGALGLDFVNYATAEAAVVASLDLGAGQVGSSGVDTFVSIEGLVGSSFADILVGDGISNLIYGGASDDFIYGMGNGDTLSGEAGADAIFGGAGRDHLFGGTGADVFVVNVADLAANVFDYVYDFEDGIDAFLLEGWEPANLFLLESGDHVVITSSDVGFASGIAVLNTTVAQVQDQILIV